MWLGLDGEELGKCLNSVKNAFSVSSADDRDLWINGEGIGTCRQGLVDFKDDFLRDLAALPGFEKTVLQAGEFPQRRAEDLSFLCKGVGSHDCGAVVDGHGPFAGGGFARCGDLGCQLGAEYQKPKEEVTKHGGTMAWG